MTIPKEIIEKVIEGGWSNSEYVDVDGDETIELAMRYWQDTVLNPTFWQALGKALGWWGYYDNESGERMEIKYAHRFYDLILQGKPTEKFWKELLTP